MPCWLASRVGLPSPWEEQCPLCCGHFFWMQNEKTVDLVLLMATMSGKHATIRVLMDSTPATIPQYPIPAQDQTPLPTGL